LPVAQAEACGSGGDDPVSVEGSVLSTVAQAEACGSEERSRL
jgi:hypothetical protein